MLFLLPVAVLEVVMWKYRQLVCHDLLDVHSSKMTIIKVNLSFGKRKKLHELRSGECGGFRTNGIPIFVKTSFTDIAVLTGSIVVMQHPSVCISSSSVRMSWTVWWFKFKSLPIIVTVRCRSDLMRALPLVTFSSVFDVQGLPERCPYTIPRPSEMLYDT
jgi:hypothetical protein